MMRALALLGFLPALAASVACSHRDGNCLLVDKGIAQAGTVSVEVQSVVTGLEVPWGIAFLPGGDMLVTERPGRVRLVRGKDIVTTVATIKVTQGSESGLLGIVLHPEFEKNRLFIVYYTHDTPKGPRNRVERWTLAPDSMSATPEKILLDDIPASPRHDGGRLRFGPDGLLYIGTGDAGDRSLPQDPSSPAGKLLRVTAEGAIPTDNPWPGKAAYLIGVRNTQGFDWLDPKTLILTDHGPSGELGRTGHDEVNVLFGPGNLGWPELWGCDRGEGIVAPSLTWEDPVPPGGAAIYTGTAIPEWRGSLLFGSLGAKHLHRVVFDPTNLRRVIAHEAYFQGDPPSGYGRLRDVIMGPDGALYVTTSNCDGRGNCPPDRDRILRITR
jgi:glucose/arabinose dehydrogenase